MISPRPQLSTLHLQHLERLRGRMQLGAHKQSLQVRSNPAVERPQLQDMRIGEPPVCENR